ncbi:MAG: ATP-dependent protease [Muricauda sp.]|uniref:Peptidase S16 lon domain protein n=1 Tax=Flagellimonas lutaonensis TaxID=516051 RepID=A0A0D5YQG5_9FLAO|nr:MULTISPECIES: LON peptidase substrate-binding domain-containing protein [Allomuricauda]AKA34123.1 Peptidase S16 lon domain protein [Allomuricauda lutaonensis]MAU25945.1 ATP-dependent protease [Allomuricauda sp.]MBC31261.1 ATP-dependent protease [Allomuricauda sp.]|tara:strand:- start:740 stop:1378 length:639 start_codon:yes stop_codon:yes gene_type:complete
MQLPFFPLQSVFFPGETVPLHIFEERYKQLINDCRQEAVTFGIPVYIDDTIAYGTEVQLVEVVTTYEGGEMDVVCVARQVFKVLSFQHEMNGKLYAGGEVQLLESVYDAPESQRAEVLQLLKELYDLMGVEFPNIPLEKFNSYAFAHKMGLSFEQEYQLLKLNRESERLSYIQRHLDGTIKVLDQINRTKEIIDMNGHFRNFDPLDFKDFGA